MKWTKEEIKYIKFLAKMGWQPAQEEILNISGILDDKENAE